MLVVQDYFSKWQFACALPDQKVDRIVQVLKDKLFSMVGPPLKFHSDQENNLRASFCQIRVRPLMSKSQE